MQEGLELLRAPGRALAPGWAGSHPARLGKAAGTDGKRRNVQRSVTSSQAGEGTDRKRRNVQSSVTTSQAGEGRMGKGEMSILTTTSRVQLGINATGKTEATAGMISNTETSEIQIYIDIFIYVMLFMRETN